MRIRFAQYPPHLNLVKLVKKSDEWVVDCLIKKIFYDTRKGKEQTTAIEKR